MSGLAIQFFSEDISFLIKKKGYIRAWISKTIAEEYHKLRELNFIFCSDQHLLSINQQFLQHDTYTDIITFDNSEMEGEIVGDIFISIERVQENAEHYKTKLEDELHRVMIHGTLHLLGYPDKGKEAKTIMTLKEDFYLAKRAF
ncbi:rRNA maturation RNase YbeY [Daejeonella sp.]|jgi:probable rRNA maturation factor|uniref:rRNA maturation RNase YbeY n=1 Tax=Daejeonella sp. TaxID=2805397 RepID=UPI003784C242